MTNLRSVATEQFQIEKCMELNVIDALCIRTRAEVFINLHFLIIHEFSGL